MKKAGKKAEQKPRREFTSLMLQCPMSGVIENGYRIGVHWLPTVFCKNGVSVFAVCSPHAIRIFMSDRARSYNLLQEMKDNGKEAYLGHTDRPGR